MYCSRSSTEERASWGLGMDGMDDMDGGVMPEVRRMDLLYNTASKSNGSKAATQNNASAYGGYGGYGGYASSSSTDCGAPNAYDYDAMLGLQQIEQLPPSFFDAFDTSPTRGGGGNKVSVEEIIAGIPPAAFARTVPPGAANMPCDSGVSLPDDEELDQLFQFDLPEIANSGKPLRAGSSANANGFLRKTKVEPLPAAMMEEMFAPASSKPKRSKPGAGAGGGSGGRAKATLVGMTQRKPRATFAKPAAAGRSTAKTAHKPAVHQKSTKVVARNHMVRGVGDPKEHGGLADEAICDMEFDALMRQIASLDEEVQARIKERRKQLKNRVHAKRAAAKRDKRQGGLGAENDRLLDEAAKLEKENAKLLSHSQQLARTKQQLDLQLSDHATHMDLLQAQLQQLTTSLARAQQAKMLTAPAPTATTTTTEIGRTVPLPTATEAFSVDTMDVQGLRGLLPYAAFFAHNGAPATSSNVGAALVPDTDSVDAATVESPHSPGLDVDMHELKLIYTDVAPPGSVPVKHKRVDDVSVDPPTRTPKRSRSVPPPEGW